MKWILVVGERDITEVIRILLEEWGYSVETLNNGESSLISYFGFDLMLTDFNMPRINGIELIRLVKKTQPDMKCILMSSDSKIEFLAQKEGVPFFNKFYIWEQRGQKRLKNLIEKEVGI